MSYFQQEETVNVHQHAPADQPIPLTEMPNGLIALYLTGMGGAVDFTLATPPASWDGICVMIKNYQAGSGFNANLLPAAGTINGAANYDMAADLRCVTLRWDNTNTNWVLEDILP